MIILSSPYIITQKRAYIYSNTILDDKITFKSTLRARDLTWVSFSNILLIFLTLGLAFPWAKVRITRLMLENTLIDTKIGFNEYISQKQEEISALADQVTDVFNVDIELAI